VFASKASTDPRLQEALLGSFAASDILEVYGQRVIDCSFKPGSGSSIVKLSWLCP